MICLLAVVQAAKKISGSPLLSLHSDHNCPPCGGSYSNRLFVLKWLDFRAQMRLKRAEFRETLKKQIEGFYGPLYSLAWQIVAKNYSKHRMLSSSSVAQIDKLAIQDYFAKNYFIPIHSRVKSILENKLYLVDGTVVADSFYEYLEASLQETVQRNN